MAAEGLRAKRPAAVPDRAAALNLIVGHPCTPGQRTTEDRLRAFIAELQDRASPMSVAMVVGAWLRMLAVVKLNPN
jgi:hypothetical protein